MKNLIKTTYARALKGYDLVLFNNADHADPYLYDCEMCESTLTTRTAEEIEEEGIPQFYQLFAIQATDDDIHWLCDHFTGLYFVYSEFLELWILCVPHFGTPWDGVPCLTDLEYIADENN